MGINGRRRIRHAILAMRTGMGSGVAVTKPVASAILSSYA